MCAINNQDRKRLEDIKEKLEKIHIEIKEVADELDERTCNYEESFDGSPQAETMREKTDAVIEISDSIENAISEFDEAVS